MLKHVSYRSSSTSLSRPSDYSFKSDSGGSPLLLERSNSSYSSVSGGMCPLEEQKGGISPFRMCPDNASLTSTLSISSFACINRLKTHSSGTYSSTLSLSDHATVPVKIYLRRLRADMEYKTVPLSLQTTCRELVILLLTKFRLRHRDPKLFFVLMEVTVRSPSDGAPVRRQLVLEDNARPAELQQCRPKGEANFSIGVRRGGLLRVHDSILMPGSQYKSLMVAYNTTTDEAVQLLLNCYGRKDNLRKFCLHQVCTKTSAERVLLPDEFPLQVQASWAREAKASWMFVLRQNVFHALNLRPKQPRWRRGIDAWNATDVDSDNDADTTRASIISSTSCGSTSSGVSSDSVVSTCSSSGVSSSGSPVPANKPTPEESSTPPRPVPRTLFPTLTETASVSTLMATDEGNPDAEEEDSGIVIDQDPTPSELRKHSGEFADIIPKSHPDPVPDSISRDHEDLLEPPDLPPQLPPRSATISVPVPRPKPRTSIKLMSKSTADLTKLELPVPASKSRSFLSLNFRNTLKPLPFSSTPKPVITGSRSRSLPRKRFSGTESPVRSPPSTPTKIALSPIRNSCSCKSCFYI